MSELRLSDAEPFAVGGRRACYVHPEDPSKCVKVLRTDDRRYIKTGRTIVPAFLRREYDNNEDERRALRRLEPTLRDATTRHLPRCCGYVETDLGRGLVLDLVRDTDGGIARSVRELFRDGVTPDELRAAYDEFGAHLIRFGVVTRAILDHNLVAERLASGGWRLHLIDGFGAASWSPIRALLPARRRALVRRRVADGWRRLISRHKDIGDGWEWDTSRWDQGLLRHRGTPGPGGHV